MFTLCIDVLTTLCDVFECTVLCCRITSAPWCYPHAPPTSPSHPSSCTNTSDQQSSSSAATNSTRDTITTTPSSSLFCCSIHTITTAAEQFCLHSSRLVDNDSLFNIFMNSDTTGHALGPAPGPPTPVPILPRNRSTMDKVCYHRSYYFCGR